MSAPLAAVPARCCAPIGASDLSVEQAEATAALFRALADPTRVRILNLLLNSPEPVCVCELNESFELSQPTLSHHLKKLTDAGLLHRQRRGTWAYYSVDLEAVAQLAAVVSPAEKGSRA